jgi:hypothetical protein
MSNVTITPLFTGSLKPIRPAIGILDAKTAFVGIWIPSKINAEGSETERDVLHFVTSTGNNPIPADEKTLADHQVRLAYKPIRFPERWPIEDVKEYLDNPTKKIDPIECLENQRAEWKRNFDFSDETQYLYESLWDTGTYFAHPLFRTYSYDYKGGIKGVGKTKALTQSYCVAFNAVASNNMSAPALFRLIQNASCTLQIDETEKLRNPERAQDFRTILLAGYKKGMPVYRVEKTAKDQFVPEPFEVFGPKRIANIGGLEDVLNDRCIPTIMKKGKGSVINTEIEIDDPVWAKIRCSLYRLFLGYWGDVRFYYDKLTALGSDKDQLALFLQKSVSVKKDLTSLTARDLELWKPLLALSLFFDSKSSECDYTRKLVDFALMRIQQKVVENVTQTGEMILADTLFKLTKHEDWADGFHAVKEIRKAMQATYDEEQKWLSNEWTGRALGRLGFLDKRRLGSGTQVKLQKDIVTDLAERLGVSEGSASSEGSEGPESSESENLDQYGSERTLPSQPTQPTLGKDVLLSRKETLLHLKNLDFPDPEDFVDYLAKTGIMTKEEASEFVQDALMKGVMARDAKTGKYAILLHTSDEMPGLSRVGAGGTA